ncbi:MAG: DUF4062 domain-containing protein, partial [Blastocatellia bacterium]
MSRLRVFVSSVQKELESERLAVVQLVSTDSFLSAHCEPVLYELLPASPQKAVEDCLDVLRTCEIYLCIIYQAYGSKVGKLSITHQEYRGAKAKKMDILAYIKDSQDTQREAGTQGFFDEIRKDGFKYKRFATYPDLQREVRTSLL